MLSHFLARRRFELLVASALSLGASGSLGCRTSCDDAVDSTPELFTGGQTDASGDDYQSAPWNGRYLKFPPSKVYEFKHGLRAAPIAIEPYVAFSECPYLPKGSCDDDDNPSGQAAPAAGDIAPITFVGPDSFRVTNTTCQTFYLRVTAHAADFGGAGSVGGGDTAGAGGAAQQ